MSLKRSVIKKKETTMWEHYVRRDYRFYMDSLPPDPIIDMLPKPMQYAHFFWSWVWILSIPGCLSLVFVRWWLVFTVFIVPVMIFRAVKRSCKEFVIEYAYESKDFFDICFENGVIKIYDVKHGVTATCQETK